MSTHPKHPTPRVPPAEEPYAPAAKEELDRQRSAHGRVTNMKRTLAHSPEALSALMQWYPLRAAVARFLGDRATTLFAHAVSAETDCLICSTFFRRILADSGEDPDHPALDVRTAAIVDYGVALARDQGRVPDAIYERLSAFLDDKEMVALTAFGAMMIATNIVNNALQVELDEYLWAYRRPDPQLNPSKREGGPHDPGS
jgi:alkylhydroperoxidase family enzyme